MDVINLENKLTSVFKPLGVAAFSRCCRFACTETYADRSDFQAREGVYFFRFHLDGINYQPDVYSVAVHYDDIKFLLENWSSEEAMIHKWCKTIAVHKSNYTIIKPTSEDKSVMIEFVKPLKLLAEMETDQ